MNCCTAPHLTLSGVRLKCLQITCAYNRMHVFFVFCLYNLFCFLISWLMLVLSFVCNTPMFLCAEINMYIYTSITSLQSTKQGGNPHQAWSKINWAELLQCWASAQSFRCFCSPNEGLLSLGRGMWIMIINSCF
jgi:hypothetical protein